MAVKRMYLLSGGILNADRSILLAGTDIGQKIKAPVISLLLIHEQGPVLVDTGLNPEGLTNPEGAWGARAKLIKPELTELDDIRNRLKEAGLRVEDVKMVILTHLHWDHTGGLRFFTHCPIVVQKEEHRFAYQPDSFVAAQYMPNHINFQLQYRLLEGDQVLLPGISVMKTQGHTPGHQSVLIRLGSGAFFIFAGDTISLEDNLTYKNPGSNSWSAHQSTESIYRLEHLSQLLPAQIIPSHDIQKWSGLKKFPEFYD